MALRDHNGEGADSEPDPCGSDDPWFVVWTKPNREETARDELSNQGFPVFLPLLMRRFPGGRSIDEPMFPRYLFARPRPDGSWWSMRNTRGVGYVLIHPGGEPRLVPAVQIKRLLRAVQAPRRACYKPGDRVMVLSGPFAGFDAVVDIDAGERVRLLHEILGRPSRHWYRPEDLEAA